MIKLKSTAKHFYSDFGGLLIKTDVTSILMLSSTETRNRNRQQQK